MATFKRELKRIRRGQFKFRTREERDMIDTFIKKRLRKAAKEGKNSADFFIAGAEVIKNSETNEVILLKKSDYISFALRHRLKYAVYIDLNYKEQNKIVLFF